MPHVDIKCFPRDLNDEQKAALAEDIAEVIIRHFNSKDSSVSVALNQVNQEDWKAQVWDTEIGPKLDDAPRDKCAPFREINGIAAAFQYSQKNYNPTASSFL